MYDLLKAAATRNRVTAGVKEILRYELHPGGGVVYDEVAGVSVPGRVRVCQRLAGEPVYVLEGADEDVLARNQPVVPVPDGAGLDVGLV
jgi:hypothetical protein